MEASETFGAGVDDPADDPFAGSDFGELDGDDGATLDANEAEIPTVNADGEVIDPPPAETDPTPASSPASAAGAEATPATSPAAAPSAPAAPSESAQSQPSPAMPPPAPTGETNHAAAPSAPTSPAATEPKTLADAEQAVAAAVQEVDVDDTVAAEDDLSEAQAAQDVAAAANPPEAAAAAPAVAEIPAAAPATEAVVEESSADPEDAAPPAEKKDKRDRVTHRRYTILQVLGPDDFKRVSWYEDKDGKMVARGNGAKRQRIALARDGEQALAIGYAALGSPEKGVTLVAVAVSLFQPKTVQPDEPEPAKRKLKIS